jgi:hypothetical protein
MSKSKRIKPARYVIAIDLYGVYLRRTLCVIHDGVTGEARYDTKPVRPSQAPLRIRQAYHAVRLRLTGK